MNERLKELMKQCTSWSDGSTWTSREIFDKEKFAELIVKDCLDIVDKEVSGMSGVRAMQKIAKHFEMLI